MTDKCETLRLYRFFQRFPDEKAARYYFENSRWAGKVSCPRCGSHSVADVKNHKPMPYRCRDCRQHFSVRTGTALAESRLPLHKWLMAILMMTAARKGIPSSEMARELGITEKSAWFLAQRIHATWLADQGDGMSDGIEGDENCVGGRSSVAETSVADICSEADEVRALVVADIKAPTLGTFVLPSAIVGATNVAEPSGGYVDVRAAAINHTHTSHLVGQYVQDMARTKGIESVWSLLKRGCIRIYNYLSAKHPDCHVNEYRLGQNAARAGTMPFIEITLRCAAGKRRRHKGLCHA